MRAIYYDRIEPEKVWGYIMSIYEEYDADEKRLELEDIEFLIKHSPDLFPEHAEEIVGTKVRAAVWGLQDELTRARSTAVEGIFNAISNIYSDREPPLVRGLAEAVAVRFERDRFATKRELDELKKCAADASVLFPAEFLEAQKAPEKVRALFVKRERDAKAATSLGGTAGRKTGKPGSATTKSVR